MQLVNHNAELVCKHHFNTNHTPPISYTRDACSSRF